MSKFFEMAAEASDDASRLARRAGHGSDFRFELRRPGEIAAPAQLRWTWASEHPLPDWPVTIDGIRVVSTRLRSLLDEHRGRRDSIQWLTASISTADGTSHPFWVPHFPEPPDVYHRALTTWGLNGLPIRWVLDVAKLDGHTVFGLARDTLSIIASKEVVEGIRAIGATGVDIAPARSA